MPVLYFAFPFCLFTYYHNIAVSQGGKKMQACCLAGILTTMKTVWKTASPNSHYFFGLVQVARLGLCLVVAVLGNWERFCLSLRNKCSHS